MQSKDLPTDWRAELEAMEPEERAAVVADLGLDVAMDQNVEDDFAALNLELDALDAGAGAEL